MSPRPSNRRSGSRRGMVAVQVALSLTALLGVAAIALDGGTLLAERRHAQATADAAALAGAVDLFKNYPSRLGRDSTGSAAASARTTAAANYAADVANMTVVVNIPPTGAATAYYNGKDGYVEVEVTYNQKRGFSAIWGSARIPVTARAIARGQWVLPGQGIITLNPTDRATLALNGTNTLVTVNGGTIIVNSENGSALTNAGTMTATGIDVTGDYSGGGTFSTTPETGTPAVEDPLKTLPAPSPPPPAPAVTIASGRKVSLGAGNFLYTLAPGSYDGNGGPAFPALKSGDVAIFEQASSTANAAAGGIYYLYKGLGSTGANLTMDPLTTGGIMFFNAGSGPSQSFSISGNATGTVNLSALDGSVASSELYKGILYFQARGSTQDVTVSGNGSFTMLGTFYAPSGGLKITGNTSTPPSVIGSQYISNTLTISGGGAVVVDYSSGLVAPVRFLGLAE